MENDSQKSKKQGINGTFSPDSTTQRIIITGEEDEEKSKSSFSGVWKSITRHWIALVVFSVVSLIGGLVYGLTIKKPVWQSQGEAIVIAKSGTGDASNLDYSLSILPSVVSFIDGTYVMNNVRDATNKEYGKYYTTTDIQKMVGASAQNYSSVEKSIYIDITAKTADKDFSMFLVNTVLTVSENIANNDSSYSLNFKDTFITASTAKEPTDTSFSNVGIALIAVLAGAVVGAIYGVIYEAADSHIVSTKNLEALTGIKNIGTIPYINGENDAKKGNDDHD
jgi:capsular polysaccharide biosynthesis protein